MPPKRPAGIGNMTVTVILSVAVVLLLSGGIIHFRHQQGQRDAGVLQARILAEGVVGRLADQLGLYSSVITRFAADPRLAQLFATNDWKALQHQEQRLARLLPLALRIRIFPTDWDGEVGPDPRLSLSFASLEMLQEVERHGKASPAEVHKVGSDQQHIALAAPIARQVDGKVVGVLLLALPFETLEQAIDASADYPGYVVFQQLTEATSVPLVAYRRQQMPDAAIDGEIEVPGTIWRAVYRGDAETAGWKGAVMLAAVLGTALAAIGLLVFLLSKRLGRVLGERLSLSQAALGKSEGEGEATGKTAEAVEAIPQAAAQPLPAEEKPITVKQIPPESIFRAYDIRGIAGETLTADGVYALGQAIGTTTFAQGEQTVIIGRDGRESSPELSDALRRGLTATGCDVVDLGEVPTPVLYFATHFLGASSGVVVTGSHNSPEYNGLKIVIGGETLHGDQIQELRHLIEEDNLLQGEGSVQPQDLIPDYIDRVSTDVQLLRPLKLVVDCGNGVASVVAPALFEALGCNVTSLFCEMDGRFPNHHPDPGNPENLQPLIQAVRDCGADLGVAFDGDGDRLGVVDSSGKIIWPDRLLMLLARDVLLRQPGADVIYDIKSSRHLAGEILTYGGRPIMWKSGHSLIKAKMRETGALLAGEMSGHIFFQERWYGFDDALYSCARLLEVLSAEGLSSAELFAQLPESPSTPELSLAVTDGESSDLVQRLIDRGQFPAAKLITIDGIRVEFENGWGLARPSNTSPAVMFRFEADSPEAMEQIQGLFRQQLMALEPGLKLPF